MTDWENVEDVRAAIGRARRVVVKVGSSSLSSASDGLDVERLGALVKVLADAHDAGRDVVLISSGAIAAGLAPLGLARRPRDLAHQQAAAAVGQGLLIEHYTQRFQQRNIRVGQVLITVDDVTRRASYANALRTMGTLIRMGVIPVVNENDTVATHEIRFGDNDRIAALIAQLVRADALVLLSDVDGLYTADPGQEGAERIDFVPDVEDLEVDTRGQGSAGIGSGGMTTKLQAAQIATGAGIPVVLARANQAARALAGDDVGTAFAPTDKRRPRRMLWLAYASTARGKLLLDQGAVDAICGRHASLLAAGVTAITGDFEAGDPVDLVAPNGEAIARGLVNFSSSELPKMLGRKSADLAADLGIEYEREIVHTDALMLLRQH